MGEGFGGGELQVSTLTSLMCKVYTHNVEISGTEMARVFAHWEDGDVRRCH